MASDEGRDSTGSTAVGNATASPASASGQATAGGSIAIADATAPAATARATASITSVAAAHIRLPSVSVVPAGPPHTYLGVARALLAGVEPLVNASPAASIPLALVSAQLVECALKAYLSRSGDDKRLRGNPDVRHNLIELWQLAESEGLALQSPHPEWLATLSLLHDRPFVLRYSPGVHAISTPSPEPMATNLASLVELVSRSL